MAELLHQELLQRVVGPRSGGAGFERAVDRAMRIEIRRPEPEVIDGGEAFLLASLAERPACLLTTGDRRALIALGQALELDDVREKVRGRIVSLETALILLVNQLGADPIGRRFAALKGCHKTIDILFGHKASFEPQMILEEINSSLNDLRRRMIDDLLFPV